MLPDRLGEVGQGRLGEVPPGLEPGRPQEADLRLPGRCSTWNIVLPGQEGREPSTERGLLAERHFASRRFRNSRARARYASAPFDLMS